MGDFDVEAMHLVEFDAQAGDAGAFAFARFQREQKFAAVGLDAAQLVELKRVARRDDAAFAQHDGRLGLDRSGEQGEAGFGGGEVVMQVCQQCRVEAADGGLQLILQLRQGGEAGAQRREVARACALQGDARGATCNSKESLSHGVLLCF